MKLKGEVMRVGSTGESILVEVNNVRGERDAEWCPYREKVTFEANLSQARAFAIGTVVEFDIRPKRAARRRK